MIVGVSAWELTPWQAVQRAAGAALKWLLTTHVEAELPRSR